MKPYVDNDMETVKNLAERPDLAAAYLNAVLDDGDEEEVALALHQVALATGLRPQELPQDSFFFGLRDFIHAAGMKFALVAAPAV